MDENARAKARADAERLLTEFGPTPDEATFIREQGEAVFTAVLDEFLKRTREGSVRMRPMTLEVAVAYPAFAAAAWARHAEREQEESHGEKSL